MKKNLIYLGILVVLAVVAYFAFNRQSNPFPEGEADFSVSNVEDVTDIFLSIPRGEKVHLKKERKDYWSYNGRGRALQVRIESLLEALKEQEATQVLPESQHDLVIKEMAGNAVKVEVYKKDKKVNAFYVNMQPTAENAAVMLNVREDGSNASRPYIVKQGIRTNFLGIRYKPNEVEWRDKQILYVPKGEITEIDLKYSDNPEFNFTLNTQPNLQVTGDTSAKDNRLNEERAKTYLAFYDNLYCMGFENDYILKDTFVKAFTPIVKISVKSKDEKMQELKVYYRQVHKGTHYVLNVNGKKYDGDTFFGYLNNKDFVLLSKNTVQKLLRSYSDFYQKDTLTVATE